MGCLAQSARCARGRSKFPPRLRARDTSRPRTLSAASSHAAPPVSPFVSPGRLFDGRTIRCFFITEETFAALHRDSANAAAADAAGGVSSAGGEGQEVVDGAGGEEEPRSLGEGAGGASGALPAAGQQEAQGEDAAAGTGLREDLQRADAAAAAAAGAPPAAEPEEGGEN